MVKEIKKQRILDQKIKEIDDTKDLKRDIKLSQSFDVNVQMMKNLFINIDTIMYKEFTNSKNSKIKYCLVTSKALVNQEVLATNVIKPLMQESLAVSDNIAKDISEKLIQVEDIKTATTYKQVVEAVTYGEAALIISGSPDILIIDVKELVTRALSEPESEKVLKGPREGFNESIMVNLGMVHRRLRTNDFKVKLFSCGETSNTKIALCYIDSYVNKSLLNVLIQKFQQMQVDNILDSNYIAEMLRYKNYSPFRIFGTTERPDVLASRILEGRVAILVDGSPIAITIPKLFIENFQSPEDYYVNFYYATFSRYLRILAFFLTIITPGVYIAIVAFHHEMLPTNLLINIALERQAVPLPASLEVVVMMIVFDILRETGVRTPQSVGQALSIVGALVIGQSAVEAKLVAAPIIIVVAFTGITSLLVPRMSGSIIFCRYFLIALASLLGFVGVTIGLSMIMIHLVNLQSFGIPQISPLDNLKYYEVKDILLRAPMWDMKKSKATKITNKETGIVQK